VVDSPTNDKGAEHEHPDFLKAHPDAIRAQSVKDAVDKIIKTKTEKKCDCIKRLVFIQINRKAMNRKGIARDLTEVELRGLETAIRTQLAHIVVEAVRHE
jgi:hypothetical protein